MYTVPLNENNFLKAEFYLKMGPWQLHPLRVRVDLEVIATKGYSTLLRSSELEYQYLIKLIDIARIPVFKGELTPMPKM